jgi:hypothetical protein
MLKFYRRMQKQNPSAVLVGTLGLLFGGPMTLGAVWSARTDASAQHWPHAIGTISSASKDIQSGNSDEYDLVASYDYTVAGKDRTNQGTLASGNSDEMDHLLAKTPPGTPLDIRYDPKDQDDSMLDQDVRHPPYGILLIIPTVAVASLVSLVQVARATKALPWVAPMAPAEPAVLPSRQVEDSTVSPS